MAQADATLITPRRNFLIRALGFTAAGATVAVPVLTLASPQARIDHHLKALKAAVTELYGVPVRAHWSPELRAGFVMTN